MNEFIDEGDPALDTTKIAQIRAEALANNQTTYFTGKPCPWGHVATRYVNNSNCTLCRGMKNARKAETAGREFKPRGAKMTRAADKLYGSCTKGKSQFSY